MRFDPYNQNFAKGQRQGLLKGLSEFLKKPGMLNRIVLIFTVFYVIFLLTWLYMYLFAVPLKFGETDFRFFVRYISLPASWEGMLFVPWTIVTHFLLHTSFFQFVFHMFAFAVFGKLFFDFWSNARFLFLLLASAISGALAFMFTPVIFPTLSDSVSFAMLNGAGAMVFGLMMYVFVYIPDHSFVYMMIVHIKLKYIVLIFVVLELLTFNAEMPGIHFAYLGGAMFGSAFALISKFIVSRQLLKPKMKVNRKRKSSKQKPEPVHTMTDEEYNLLKKKKQERVDAILDKISRLGYGSLTQEEKDFLFFESKK